MVGLQVRGRVRDQSEAPRMALGEAIVGEAEQIVRDGLGGGGLDTPRLVRFLVRALLAAGLVAAVAGGAAWLLDDLLGDDRSKLESLAFLAVVAAIDGVLYLLLARAFRLAEVNELVEMVTRRLPLRRRG